MAAGAHDDAKWVCGLSDEVKPRGGQKVWRHKYSLAAKAARITTRDKYIFNEHWHSASQDGVI